MRLANVALVDDDKEMIYKSNLFAYYNNNIARKIMPINITKGGNNKNKDMKITPNQSKLTSMIIKRDKPDEKP